MAPTRRIYKRVTTNERIRIDLATNEKVAMPLIGETFTVEVYREDQTGPQRIFMRKHKGRVEVEEMQDGEFRLTGHI